MMNPFDSPMGNNLVRMMAETVFFEGQGGVQYDQKGQGDGGATAASCFQLASNMISSLSKKYSSPDNTYHLYQYTNYNDNKFYLVSWDGSSAPPSKQKSDYKQFLRGVGADAGPNCTVFTNPGFSQLFSGDRFNTQLNNNKWKELRDSYEAGRAGCTASSAPNYNSAALKLDNSCQFWKDSTVHTKNSAKAADGVRFEGKVETYIRPIILTDGSESEETKLVSTISEVCTNSRCAINGERRNVSVWNQTTSPFPLSEYNNEKSAAISVLDAKVAELAGAYTANCGLTAQSPTQYKKATSCDGAFKASMDKQLFISNCDGSVEKIIYTASDGNSWTWVKGDGSSAAWEIDNIQDPNGREGYGGATDYVKTLVENYENGLSSTTSITYDKVAQTSRGVVGAPNDGLFVVVVRATPVITDGCGKKTQSASEYTYYGYQYADITDQDSEYFNDKPKYDGLSETGIPTVSFAGSTIQPTSTNVRDNNRVGTYEELYGKVISGCTDTNATNYDDKANTNRGCKYPLNDGDGDGDGEGGEGGDGEGFNIGVLAITAVVFGGLYYFLR